MDSGAIYAFIVAGALVVAALIVLYSGLRAAARGFREGSR